MTQKLIRRQVTEYKAKSEPQYHMEVSIWVTVLWTRWMKSVLSSCGSQTKSINLAPNSIIFNHFFSYPAGRKLNMSKNWTCFFHFACTAPPKDVHTKILLYNWYILTCIEEKSKRNPSSTEEERVPGYTCYIYICCTCYIYVVFETFFSKNDQKMIKKCQKITSTGLNWSS